MRDPHACNSCNHLLADLEKKTKLIKWYERTATVLVTHAEELLNERRLLRSQVADLEEQMEQIREELGIGTDDTE